MNIGKLVPLVFLTIAAVGITAGTAHADEVAPPIQIAASTIGDTIVTTLDNGFFVANPGASTVAITDVAGNTVADLPLSLGGAAFTPEVTGDSTLVLTPLVHNVASPAENDAAYQSFLATLNPGVSAAATVGAVLGTIVGCLLVLIAACIPGAVLGGVAGAAIGGALAGGPVVTDAAINVVQTFLRP